MPRLRELGLRVGELTPGSWNAITDVPDVLVGHRSVVIGEGALQPGFGPARTGVTVILPHSGNLYLEKVPAAVHTLNGYGKAAGFEQVRELGVLEAPVAFTNTLNVGLTLDALVQYMIRQNPQIGVRSDSASVNIVVGETNDSYLNDIQGRHVRAEDVWVALENARGGAVSEGNVGAGTGTVCYGWKGGIGTSSRILPPVLGSFTLGALVQSNFGSRQDLTILGAPVGKQLNLPADPPQSPPGSIMIALATDAPLSSRQLQRLCARAAIGLGRTGARMQHGSGDFVIAFSVAHRIPHHAAELIALRPALADEGKVMNGLFQAVIECVEEAVLNSLFCAETLVGRDGHIAYALPVDEALRLIQRD